MTAQDIVYAAFTELGVKPPDQPLAAEPAAWGFDKLNRLIDTWATRRLFVYAINHNTYSMPTVPLVTASPQYWSIGPTGADITATRPVRIEDANVVLTQSSPYTFIPLPVINTDDFANLRVPTLTSTIPTKLYYQPAWPNGRLFPWPFPTTLSNQLQLFTWNQIAQFTSAFDTFTLPPGYWDAIVFSLAESMLPTYPALAAAEMITEYAKRGRYAIQSLNSPLPNIVTRDSGIPSGGGRNNQASWNWRSGDFNSPRGG